MKSKSALFLKFSGVLVAAFILISATKSTDNRFFEIAKNLEIFTNVFKELNTHYVDEIEPGKLVRTGLDAMLASLDPYTNYISESEIEGYRFMTTGKYGGIGSLIRTSGDYVIIAEPYEGFPAHKAGLKAGDIILSVDGKSAKGKRTDELSDVLKGTPGTSVEVEIQRPGTDKTLDIELERAEVKVPNVPYYGMLEDGIGYITLTTFTENAGKNVEEALVELKKKNDLKGVIFDLRGNGGGLLREAINVSNVFVNKNETIVTTKSKVAEWDKSYKTLNSPVDLEIPLVVMINGGSASASEIVSGAIQDFDRGVLVGSRTYGKGLVQNTRDVGYNSKIKLTISKYYIPSGRCIQGVNYADGEAKTIDDSLKVAFKTRSGRTVYDGGGVAPDIEVEKKSYPLVLRSLIGENLIFDYLTQYMLTHPSVENFEAVGFTDEDYASFKAYLSDKSYSYETASEKSLAKLEAVLEKDFESGFQSELVESLRANLKKEKSLDIDKHKSIIMDELNLELATRYYYQTGKIRMSLKQDADVSTAIDILKDKTRYDKLLK